jgi:hypothetical protein
MTIQERLEAYLEAREDYDVAHDLSSKAHARMKALETELVDEMVGTHTQSHGTKDGIHVSLRKQFNCSVTQANETQIRNWLNDTEGDDSQFVVEKVHKPALVEWLKQKDYGPEDVPDFLKLSTRPGITVRGWNTREKE